MDLPEFEAEMRKLAKALDEYLENLYNKKVGFCLINFEFNNPGISHYISNANREDMINSLKETIKRWENNEDIPAAITSTKQ